MSQVIKWSILSFPIASAGLGVWQLKRLKWKKNLIKEVEARLSDEPIDLFSIDSIEDLKNKEYHRIKVKGRFDRDPEHQIIMRPRLLVPNDESIARGLPKTNPKVGAHVITPFQLADSNLRILINRGWMPIQGPNNYSDYSSVGLGPENKDIEVIGISRKSDKSTKFGMSNDEQTSEWQFRDIDAMARKLETAPIYIEAEASLSPVVGPIGGQTQLKIRDQHLEYAVTWFSLTLATTFLWYTYYFSSKKLRRKVHGRFVR